MYIFRKNIGRYLTPEDQSDVWSLLEEPPVDHLQACTFQAVPGVDPGIAKVMLCVEGIRVWLQLVTSDPGYQGRHQETLDREVLGRIRRAIAEGNHVVLVGTAAARPLPRWQESPGSMSTPKGNPYRRPSPAIWK